MNIDIDKIQKAQKILCDMKIVCLGVYKREFKGYISSFGAAVVTSGLKTTLDHFKQAKTDRRLLENSIILYLKSVYKYQIDEDISLSKFLSTLDSDKQRKLTEHILDAINALKYALRLYMASDKTVKPRNSEAAKNDKDEQDVIDIKNKICRLFPFDDNILNKTYAMTDLDVNSPIANKMSKKDLGYYSFLMKTVHSGLIIGGSRGGSENEENANADSEYQNSIHFDHSTCLPVISGSSVKGVLKSVFPIYDLGIDRGSSEYEYNKYRSEYLKELFVGCSIELPTIEGDIELIEFFLKIGMSLFERSDVYFDAILKSFTGNRFINSDYITPHKDNPLKGPTVLKIAKIKSDVKFKFFFKLKTSVIVKDDAYTFTLSPANKLSIFIRILEDIGIGAKTNLGYGRLIKC